MPREDGGCEKALGWGVNTGSASVRLPSAVAFSSSSESDSASYSGLDGTGMICSFELVMT